MDGSTYCAWRCDPQARYVLASEAADPSMLFLKVSRK
jgi:hypothetical protein